MSCYPHLDVDFIPNRYDGTIDLFLVIRTLRRGSNNSRRRYHDNDGFDSIATYKIQFMRGPASTAGCCLEKE